MESSDHNNVLPPTLSMEVVTEILLRLPPKPLARLKVVSKPWNDLIGSRKFILTHINRSLSSLSNLHLALFSDSTLYTLDLPSVNSSPPNHIPVPFTSRTPDADTFGSAHGLLGISDYPNFLSLFNPTNRTFRVIPVQTLAPRSESHWVDFGLGHDPVSGDYKIVRVDQLNGPGLASSPMEVRVYSVKEAAWRKLRAGFPHYLAHPKAHGKFVDGSLLFLATTEPPTVYDLDTKMATRGQADETLHNYLIVKFDLRSEEFCTNTIGMPDGYDRGNGGSSSPEPWLAVLGGELVLQVEHGPTNSRVVDLWRLRDQEERESIPGGEGYWWIKLFSFPLSDARPGKIGRLRPMVVSEDWSWVLIEQNKQYFWYGIDTGEVRDMELKGHLSGLYLLWGGGHPCVFGAVPYVESLVALDNGGLEHAEARGDGETEGPSGGRISFRDVEGGGFINMMPRGGFLMHGRGRGRVIFVPFEEFQGGNP